MRNLRRVCIVGGQPVRWALDEDLLWLRKALPGLAVEAPLPVARIVLAAWWPALAALPAGALAGKRVVCFADNPPSFYLGLDDFPRAAGLVDLWVARAREAEVQFEALGLPVARAPYVVNPCVFRPLPDRAALRAALGLGAGDLVIGNFHRDSEGSDLTRPKLQKGPDVLLEVAIALKARHPGTVVLLAGPRRHWLRRHLAEAGVRCVFAGRAMAADDYPANILARPRLNELYQCLDVCVVSSRWEGGPYSVLEALLAGRPVVSTPVGIARDLLPPEAIFRNVDEAIERILSPSLSAACLQAGAAAARTCSIEVLRGEIEGILAGLPDGAAPLRAQLGSALALALGSFGVRGGLPPSRESVASAAAAVRAEGPVASETPLDAPRGKLLEDLIATARHWRRIRSRAV